MAERQFQPFLNPRDEPADEPAEDPPGDDLSSLAQSYNLPSDPPNYETVFTSIDERMAYIKNLMLFQCYNKLKDGVTEQIEAEDIGLWFPDQILQWGIDNHYAGNVGDLYIHIGLNDVAQHPPEFDRKSYNFRAASHLPMRQRFRIQPPPPEGSPESSRSGQRRATENSQQRSGSPERDPRQSLSQEDEDEIAKRVYRLMLEREIKERMKPFNGMFFITFVGEQAHSPAYRGFKPCRGDLIISHPDSRHLDLPNSVGYIASYGGRYKFTPRDLVLRVGTLATTPAQGKYPGDSSYDAFTSVQLHAYNLVLFASSPWRFLGHQARLLNSFDVFNPPDRSPGKFLMVGSPVLGTSSNFVEALVPRRGDIIIKREAFLEDFDHDNNFWYSMVKWHKGRQFPFLPGDMLVRLLVDLDPRNRYWGRAELYIYEGTSVGWVFWGTTKHIMDTPWPENDPLILLYEYDNGDNSDDEIERDKSDPRLN